MSFRAVKMAARRGRPRLTPAYRAWLAENLLRGAEAAAIRAALAEGGVPEDAIAGALARARRSPELAGGARRRRDCGARRW
ncbi:hypothetical protein OV079_41610 [Nannocystis pusilla]|uniref:Uncharacterized protein n=1 Tax=Nannocystis pusilla TaxID=889268 RepID=A0A9X3EYR7_9BACT|nr:hypothetical protein [Nannocystis pusilla]MCY1011934.1 hypothetical protein [Nannocystis pusilla]